MSKYENEYLDGEDKKTKVLPLILFILLIVVILVIVISCSMKDDDKKGATSYISSIELSNGEISPKFSKNVYSYDVVATSNTITISCKAENPNTKIEGCNKQIELTTDKTVYSIKSTNNGDSKTYILNIMRKQSPDFDDDLKVSINSSVGENGKSYKLTANVEPNNLKITYTYKWYKDDKEIPNSNTKDYTATESANYYVEITNKELNLDIKSNEVYIEIKSSEKPKDEYILKINSIKGNSSSWVKSVTLSVNATASNGLANNAYSFDGGKTYQKSNSKTFTSNQTVKIIVKDSKGNIVSKSVTISKIDKTKPSVTIEVSNETESSVSLNAKVSPTSTSSGYKYQWYKNGTIINSATSKTYKVSTSGKYKVKVTTGSGNSVTSKEFDYVPLKEKCPMIYVETLSGLKVPEDVVVINEFIKITVKPPQTIEKYVVYKNINPSNKYLSKDFEYIGTFNKESAVAIKLDEKGQRILMIKTYDKNGKETTCYTKTYYLT